MSHGTEQDFDKTEQESVAEQSLNNWLDVMTTNATGVFLP
jgi:hypothetical protein